VAREQWLRTLAIYSDALVAIRRAVSIWRASAALPRSPAERAERTSTPPELTAREREVCELLARSGVSNRTQLAALVA